MITGHCLLKIEEESDEEEPAAQQAGAEGEEEVSCRYFGNLRCYSPYFLQSSEYESSSEEEEQKPMFRPVFVPK